MGNSKEFKDNEGSESLDLTYDNIVDIIYEIIVFAVSAA